MHCQSFSGICHTSRSLLFSLHMFPAKGINVASALTECHKDNTWWQLDNFCYDVIFRDMSWYEARNYCASRGGGDLAEIRTQRIQVGEIIMILIHFCVMNHVKQIIWNVALNKILPKLTSFPFNVRGL